jgi:uncharacterized protein YbjT (DUF2867 family)
LHILLTGANGFIGSALAAALLARGHTLICPRRRPVRASPSHGATDANMRTSALDFADRPPPQAWRAALDSVDVVVNTVGILQERGRQTFSALHVDAPIALFDACVLAGVRRVVQVSALGADEGAQSAYHLSKRTADAYLMRLPIESVVVQPSLVYGPGGASARLFDTLASLPVLALPGGGRQRIQPVFIDDAIDAMVALIEMPAGAQPPVAQVVPLVGPQAMSLKDYLATLRRGMAMTPAAPVVPLPVAALRAVAGVAGRLPGSLFDADTLDMLERGNVGDPADITRLLGRAPRGADRFIAPQAATAARIQSSLNWALPCLRIAMALVWIWTGIVSFGLYPEADSLALLARLGAEGDFARVLLYGAALLDLILGVLIITLRGGKRQALWVVQFGLIAFYTVAITFWLPEFWLHPYGPILKNLPMLAALLLLYQLEDSSPGQGATRWTT